MPSQTAYEEKWPEFFVEWGEKRIAEWRARREDAQAPPTYVESQQLDYDISTLEKAIARVKDNAK